MLCLLALSGCAAHGGLENSPFASREDQAQAQAACLAGKGWIVTVSTDGGITYEGPAEQLEPFRAAKEQCAQEVGGANAGPTEVTEEMLRTAYSMQVETLECLRGEGYDELSDPPTLQAYLDAHALWTPYSELPLDISEADWLALQETCPQPALEG